MLLTPGYPFDAKCLTVRTQHLTAIGSGGEGGGSGGGGEGVDGYARN